jgi:3-hydroxy acid dehydrogenase / malonic semialdehyde reductase
MTRVRVNGVELEFDDTSVGRRALLLIHGHPFDRSMWRPQIDWAAHLGWRVIAPDLRGYGASGRAGEKTPLDIFARDLLALLDHLQVERAVVAGLSMGGQIAMELCRAHPERLQGLILAATFPQAETDSGKRERYATAERLLTEGMATYAEELLPRMMAARSIEAFPEVADHVIGMMRSAPPSGAAAALRGRAERPDYREALERFEGPTLIVAGDEDSYTTLEQVEGMHALLGHSRLLWLRGVGHLPNLERPTAFNAALEEFLGRIAVDRSDYSPIESRGTVLVTGATSGFGAVIARRFAESGSRVIALGRRGERLEQLQAAYGKERVHMLRVDVADRIAVGKAMAALPSGLRDIDCLINNAGLALGLHPAHEASLADWDQMFDTNCRGLAYVTRAVIPGMVRRGRGLIVNMGSVAGTYPYPGGNVYGATKAFVRQFSLNLRSDLHGTGVRVACIEPGMCGGTEFSTVRFGGDTARAAAVYKGLRPLTAGDIADTVAWIASRPAHVNVNLVELMPVAQSFGPFRVHRAEMP